MHILDCNTLSDYCDIMGAFVITCPAYVIAFITIHEVMFRKRKTILILLKSPTPLNVGTNKLTLKHAIIYIHQLNIWNTC